VEVGGLPTKVRDDGDGETLVELPFNLLYRPSTGAALKAIKQPPTKQATDNSHCSSSTYTQAHRRATHKRMKKFSQRLGEGVRIYKKTEEDEDFVQQEKLVDTTRYV
jgi:hypothetical protein